MIRDLLFHIGDPKTGTSSIQAALNRGAWRCETVRLVPQDYVNATPLANALKTDAEPAFRERQFSHIRDWFSGHDGDLGVISSEYFARRSPPALRRALEEYFPDQAPRTRVLAYVRPHASRLISAYGQRLKTGSFAGPLEKFADYMITVPTLYYAGRFPQWRETFGEGMTLRPFLRGELRDGDVTSDFFFHALGTPEFELPGLEPANESLSVAELAGLRLIQQAFTAAELADHHKLAVGGALQRKLGALPGRGGEKPALDRATAIRVLEAYLEDARALDTAFFGRPLMEDELTRARDTAAPGAQDFTAGRHFSGRQRKRMEKAAARIAELIAAMPKAWRQEYQVSIGQRAADAIEDPSFKRRRNAKGVWQALDDLAAILAAPDGG